MPDPRAKERVGSVLHDKWTLESLLGEGGMGAVYLARHRNGARAAVKVLSPESARLPHIRKRFLHEGYAANKVDHPNAVKVLDDDVIQDGPDEGTAYLVMELLEGESLQERARREPPLGERDLLEIAYEVLGVLEAAHTNGVVHRDLKPDNLFLARDPDRDGTVIKVLDFGLARLLESGEQTIAGMALGTPTYMSPEQAAGHVNEIDGRTDIYALGSILFQLVSNRRIHDAGHTLGLVIRMATTPAPKLRTVAPDVSEPFARVVDHALEFRREDRYPNAAAMRADVSAALDLLRGTESTSLNVLSAMPADGANANAAIALADTVVGHKAAAIAKGEVVSRANVAPSSMPPPPSAKEESAAEDEPRGLPMRTFALFALLTIAALAVWRNSATIQEWLSAATASSASLSSSTTSASAIASSPVMTTSDDASAVPASDDDASTNANADASATISLDDLDGGPSGDGGEDDDDDEEDDLDASTDASSSAANPTHRRVTRSTTTPRKGTKKAPRRPGAHPRKKRWHW